MVYKKGDEVVLKEIPTGYSHQEYFPWKVGQKLTVEYMDGCCVCVTDGKESSHFSASRVTPIKQARLETLAELSALDQEFGLT